MIALHWTLFLLACSVSMIIGYFVYALMYMASCETPKMADDYIDWSKVPEGYDWVALDKYKSDGDSYGLAMYKTKPSIFEDGDWWSNGRDYILVPSDAIIGPLPPWLKSLRKRSGK